MAEGTEGKVYEGENVNLSHLAGVDAVIDHSSFENCIIFGPAVLVMQDVQLIDCDLGGGPSEILWEISDERRRIKGAILVSDSVFNLCSFINVGLAGPRALVEELKAELEEHPLD